MRTNILTPIQTMPNLAITRRHSLRIRGPLIAVLAHLAPPLSIIFSWSLLTSLGFGSIAIGSLTFHTIWIVIEGTLALYPDPAR